MRLRGLILLPLLAAALLVPSPRPASAQSAVSRNYVIYVDRYGFNGTANEFSIEAIEGERVRIEFIYNDADLKYDNPHQAQIEGYNIVTDTIGRSNPSTAVEFVVGQVGEFKIICIIPCAGMEKLQAGKLKVSPSLGKKVATNLALNLPSSITLGKTISLSATIMDADDNPVEGVFLAFYVDSTFGPMKIGAVSTSNQGIANVKYILKGPKQLLVTVVFSGSGKYQPSNATGLITYEESRLAEPEELPFSLGQNTLPDIRLVGVPITSGMYLVTIIGLIVGAVWATYGVVLYQLFKITGNGHGKRTDQRLRWGVLPVRFSFAAIPLALVAFAAGIIDSFLLNSLPFDLTSKYALLLGIGVAETAVLFAVLRRAFVEN